MHNQLSGLCFSTCTLCCSIKTTFRNVKFSQQVVLNFAAKHFASQILNWFAENHAHFIFSGNWFILPRPWKLKRLGTCFSLGYKTVTKFGTRRICASYFSKGSIFHFPKKKETQSWNTSLQSVMYIRLGSTPDPSGKKTVSEEQSTTLYNLQGDVYFKIANSEDDDQEAPFVRKIDLIRLIQE